MKYVVFGPKWGKLEECIKRKKYHFNNLIDVFHFVADNASFNEDARAYSFDDLCFRRYCYDFELKRYIYLICTNRLYDEVYVVPCALCYFVCLDDNCSFSSVVDKSHYISSFAISKLGGACVCF